MTNSALFAAVHISTNVCPRFPCRHTARQLLVQIGTASKKDQEPHRAVYPPTMHLTGVRHDGDC